jgi:Fur family transcriptional regulator, ferric uptake regulator
MAHSEDAATLRQQGYRLTPQRLMVLEVVKSSGKHLTAEDVHAAILPQHPYVNIATVYRTLQWLQEVGLVAPIATGNGPLHYEYVDGETHHHLVCQDCGYEQEIGDDILAALKAQLLERYAFTAQFHHLALPGRCATCQQSASDDTTEA